MAARRWRIGELARATGLTVRTLHHYDAIGLLRASARSPAGQRLYDERDLERLYQIRALRQLGLPLREIGACLGGDRVELQAALRRHLERVEQQLELQRRLRRLLRGLLEALERDLRPPPEQVLMTLEVMAMTEQYYTPEQQAQLAARRQMLGDEAIKRAEQEWASLIGEVEAERRRGTDPASPRLQELARHWQRLIEQFTGGDDGIRHSLQRMYEDQGVERASRGAVSPELMAYVQTAIAAGRSA